VGGGGQAEAYGPRSIDRLNLSGTNLIHRTRRSIDFAVVRTMYLQWQSNSHQAAHRASLTTDIRAITLAGTQKSNLDITSKGMPFNQGAVQGTHLDWIGCQLLFTHPESSKSRMLIWNAVAC